MEWLQSLLDSGTTPVLTAFLLGLLTAISPCPLATNIAAIGFIGKNIESRKVIFRNGTLYTLGRIVAYTVLGAILITILKEGASLFGIQKFIARYGWKSHATLTLLAKQDLPTFGYNMIAPLKSWCWGSILFYPFKISRFS